MNPVFDRYANVILLLVGFLFILESMDLSTSSYGSAVGASVFPIGLGGVLMVLSIFNLYQSYRVQKTDRPKEKLQYKRFLIILAALLLYALLLEPLGYVISTFLFLLTGFQTMEKGKMWSSIGISGCIALGVYFVYVGLMSGTLPGLPEWLQF